MKTIWKFQALAEKEAFELYMPKDAEILCVQMQNHLPCIWAIVDSDKAPRELRKFAWCGTGHPMPDNIKAYIGTLQFDNGTYVFHLFELKGWL